MPVIINELEVITAPPSRRERQQTPSQNAPVTGTKPEDITAALRNFAERRARLAAR